jgi:hypothetical protein
VSYSLVPFDSDPGLPTSRRAVVRARRAQLAVFTHGLEAWASAEEDRQDAQALADAARTSLDEELRLLRDGLALAGASAAGVELVSRKVNLVSNTNDRRIARNFG